MDEPWEHYTKWKKPGTEGHILNDSVYMECPEQTKTRNKVVIAMGFRDAGIGYKVSLGVMKMLQS